MVAQLKLFARAIEERNQRSKQGRHALRLKVHGVILHHLVPKALTGAAHYCRRLVKLIWQNPVFPAQAEIHCLEVAVGSPFARVTDQA